MALEILVGLQVDDDTKYTKYREGMIPILKEFGGSFGYDFKVSETLISKTEEPINRVFTIRFLDKESMNNFFSNEEYKKVKVEFFEPSVRSTTIISEYEV